MGRHRVHFFRALARFVPDCEVLSVPRVRSGPFPGGNWSPIHYYYGVHVLRGRLQTDMFPTPSRRIGTKKNKTNIHEVSAGLILGAEK